MDYLFKKINAIIISIFGLVVILALVAFLSRLYVLDKENKAAQAEQAALEAHIAKKSAIDIAADNMFREVLQTSTLEGLAFMELYATVIEDDVITSSEFKDLTKKYKIFIKTRDAEPTAPAKSEPINEK